jgi:hypothetical protein
MEEYTKKISLNLLIFKINCYIAEENKIYLVVEGIE